MATFREAGESTGAFYYLYCTTDNPRVNGKTRRVIAKWPKERFAPIGSTAKQVVVRYVQAFRPQPARPDIDQAFLSVDGYRLTVNAIVHMSRLAASGGVECLHAHLLRHASGVQYHLNGGDTKFLQRYLCSASIEFQQDSHVPIAWQNHARRVWAQT